MCDGTIFEQRAPPLESGSAVPNPDAGWARRQNSVMWSPMPQSYESGGGGRGRESAMRAVAETDADRMLPFLEQPSLQPHNAIVRKSRRLDNGGMSAISE